MNRKAIRLLLLWSGLAGCHTHGADIALATPSASAGRIVCIGRVEPVDGEIEVSAQMSGVITALMVSEGDCVTAGTPLAELDAQREKMALDLALAKLARVKAGSGKEEIAVIESLRDASAAELILAEAELKRTNQLCEHNAVAAEELELRQQRAVSLRHQVAGAESQVAALKRGALPEDIAVAMAEVAVARAAYEQHIVRAPADGTVLEIHLHVGDFTAVTFSTPILRMADTRRLQVRIEVGEIDAGRLKAGMDGKFSAFGTSQTGGQVRVKTVLPSFAPRRLFEPDTTKRLDSRALQALCVLNGTPTAVYSGQRVTITLSPLDIK